MLKGGSFRFTVSSVPATFSHGREKASALLEKIKPY